MEGPRGNQNGGPERGRKGDRREEEIWTYGGVDGEKWTHDGFPSLTYETVARRR